MTFHILPTIKIQFDVPFTFNSPCWGTQRLSLYDCNSSPTSLEHPWMDGLVGAAILRIVVSNLPGRDIFCWAVGYNWWYQLLSTWLSQRAGFFLQAFSAWSNKSINIAREKCAFKMTLHNIHEPITRSHPYTWLNNNMNFVWPPRCAVVAVLCGVATRISASGHSRTVKLGQWGSVAEISLFL